MTHLTQRCEPLALRGRRLPATGLELDPEPDVGTPRDRQADIRDAWLYATGLEPQLVWQRLLGVVDREQQRELWQLRLHQHRPLKERFLKRVLQLSGSTTPATPRIAVYGPHAVFPARH